MEDDNATDIIKWLFRDDAHVDMTGDLCLKYKENFINCSARLKGNLLAIKTVEAAIEPILVVCEKIKVESEPDKPTSFIISYGDSHQLYFEASDETLKERWMLKIAMASHQIVRAELDEVTHHYLRQSASTLNQSTSSPGSYFLTNPFTKIINVLIQSPIMPPRTVAVTETMYQSKICMIVPCEYMKLCHKWASDFNDLCKGKSWRSGTQTLTEAAANVVRHLNSHLEIYNQAVEFLENYNGPFFCPSTEKYSLATGAVPTNLHVQLFNIQDKDVSIKCPFVTIGAMAAHPLRFAHGGLYRQKQTLQQELDKNGKDHTNTARFYARRRILMDTKKTIGILYRKIDQEWRVSEFGSVDKMGLELLNELRLLDQTIRDLISSFPLINNLYNKAGSEEAFDDDNRATLSNRLDALEMSMISLNTKMAVLDTVDDNREGREIFLECAKTAFNSTLDILFEIITGLINAQILGFVNGLRNASICQDYFQIQLREDLMMSQAITVVSTSLLTYLYELPLNVTKSWDILPPMISYFSFLSCYSNEKGMMEDAYEIFSSFPQQVKFKFIPTRSSVSQTCIPHIMGNQGDLTVFLPLNQEMISKLGPNLAQGNVFRVNTTFWNLGVNHEATMAQSMNSVALEEQINTLACKETQKYVEKLQELFAEDISFPLQQIKDQFDDLENSVRECPSRKNMAIFTKVMTLMDTVNAIRIIGCKSGKDRTSMALTLEEGRYIKEHCSVSGDQLAKIVETLRKNGVRLENCRRNIGKSLYSFSPFQMHFLPKEFRPPTGTYGHNVKS